MAKCILRTADSQKIILWLECFILCQNTARQFGAGGDFHPFTPSKQFCSYLNGVTMPTKDSVTMYTLVFSGNNYKIGHQMLYIPTCKVGRGAVTCAWTQVKCLLIWIHSKSTESTNPLHNCTVTLLEADHNSHVQLIIARVNHSVHLRLHYKMCCIL